MNQKDYIKIIDTPNKKTSEILAECKKLFPVYCYWDDKELDNQFPAPKKDITTYYHKNIEADEEFKNLSANDLKEKYPDKKFITLRERLIMELAYFKETGKHLDIDNITLCAGSRSRDGDVSGTYWDGDEFRVRWCDSDGSDGGLRSRQQISLPLSLDSSSLKPKKVKDKDVAPVEIVYKNNIYVLKQ